MTVSVTPWTTVATRWGLVEPVRASELFASQQSEGRVTTRVLMRRYPGLSNHHRLVFGGRVLNLIFVPDVGVSEPMMALLCTEAT